LSEISVKALLNAVGLPKGEQADPVADDVKLDDLYRTYAEELANTLKKRFGAGPPEPEDVVQATFTKYASLEDPASVRNPKAYLFRTARNIILNHKRQNQTADAFVEETQHNADAIKLEQITPERVLLEKERVEIMAAVMKTLPRKQQVVLTMNRLQGKTYAEIKAVTGWSMGDIHRQMTTGIEVLSEALKKAAEPH